MNVPLAEANLEDVEKDDWAELAGVSSPSKVEAAVLEAFLLLLGEPNASSWEVAQKAVSQHESLLAEVRSLGSWGFSEEQVAAADAVLNTVELPFLKRTSAAEAAGSGASAAKALQQAPAPTGPAAKGKAKAGPAPAAAKAKAKAAAAAKAKPAAKAASAPAAQAKVQCKKAVEALANMAQAWLSVRQRPNEAEQPPPFSGEDWPSVPFWRLHHRLSGNLWNQRHSVLVCESQSSFAAAREYFSRLGPVTCDVGKLQVKVGLSKSKSKEEASLELGRLLEQALSSKRPLLLVLGNSPAKLETLLVGESFPKEVFAPLTDKEPLAQVLKKQAIPSSFNLVFLVQMQQAQVAEVLTDRIPQFAEMETCLLKNDSLPSVDSLAALPEEPPSLRSALKLLALPVEQAKGKAEGKEGEAAAGAKAPGAEPPAKDGAPPAAAQPATAAAATAPAQAAGGAAAAAAAAPAQAGAGGAAASGAAAAAPPLPAAETVLDPDVNYEEFEYTETFGEDYTTRWFPGPATKDEHKKDIKKELIKATLVKYPANPKDAKMCLQLVGGAANAPCTGLWASFSPLCQPSEIEFEFTMNGKVDLPNATLVFTEQPFEGALPDCKVGVQFTVRGGMYLCGGGGQLVKISNDGKIQNDRWNKVLLKIDWKDKVIVGQVDTKGKGYAPAIQTVQFRDSSCRGFGYCYLYNTDVQGTCWFSSLRIKQASGDAFSGLNTDGLEARAVLARRLQEREYQRAVDGDMAVGMKMGAIKCTKNHGMNLAEEQRANNSSSFM